MIHANSTNDRPNGPVAHAVGVVVWGFLIIFAATMIGSSFLGISLLLARAFHK